MLLTGLLHENIDNINQSLIKIDLEKIQKITTSIFAGIEASLSVEHEGGISLENLPLLTIENTLIDICFDWHPNHVGVKQFPLKTLT